jgi:hypothetical protein
MDLVRRLRGWAPLEETREPLNHLYLIHDANMDAELPDTKVLLAKVSAISERLNGILHIEKCSETRGMILEKKIRKMKFNVAHLSENSNDNKDEVRKLSKIVRLMAKKMDIDLAVVDHSVKDNLSAKMGRSEPSVRGPKETVGVRPPKSPVGQRGPLKKAQSSNTLEQPGSKSTTPRKR